MWPERQLPRSEGVGLDAAKRAIDKAEAEGRLLGCCSRACRAKLPKSYGADFKLQTNPHYWGKRAAGLLIVAKKTGRILLTLRSEEVSQPLTWAIPGGKLEDGETPRAAALREAEEELGYDGQIDVEKAPFWVYRDDDFEYSTFLAFVSREFEAQLNEENDDAEWFDPLRLPRPLHFGLSEMFDAIGKLPNVYREAVRR